MSLPLCLRRATLADLELLVTNRLEVLRAANGLPDDADLSTIAAASRAYYQAALDGGGHVAYLAFAAETFVGCGGVSFYQVLPTCHTPTGEKAYIMNMYTRPSHRRQGVARAILAELVRAARARGVTTITLEATAAGRPLYQRFGFVPLPDEMELPQEIADRPAK